MGIAGTAEVKRLFVGHLRGIVEHFGPQLFGQTVFVIGHEANTGREHEHNAHQIALDEWLRQRCCVLCETSRPGEPGLHTDEWTKEAMHHTTEALLSAGALRMHSEWFTTNRRRDDLCSKFERQMHRYSKIQDVVKRKNGTYDYSKPRYTGKIGGEQDDLCMALQLALMARTKFRGRGAERYQRWL